MAGSWNAEQTKAADMQSQIGVVWNKTIYIKPVSPAGHQETIPPTPLFHLQ